MMRLDLLSCIANRREIKPHPSENNSSPARMSGMSVIYFGSSFQSIWASEKSKPIRFAPKGEIESPSSSGNWKQRTFRNVHYLAVIPHGINSIIELLISLGFTKET